MRGKVAGVVALCVVGGITPAYAGKSEERNPSEYVLLGSPPPMRGKGILSPYLAQAPRITPAYAGKRKIVGTSVQRK